MKELMIPDNKNLAKIDTLVGEYLETEISGKLTKALVLGNAITTLDNLLTKEIMAPIMKLAGSKLGFRTDKDLYGGYTEDIVKRCFIEALLVGVEPVGNQFNIIANNLYVTKEGCTHLLSQIKGLTYSVVPQIPAVIEDKGEYSALCKVKVFWTINSVSSDQELEFSCKGATDRKGKHITGMDAYNGKAERKAKHWLYSQLSGQYVGEGEVEDSIDVKFEEVSTESPYKKKEKPDEPNTDLDETKIEEKTEPLREFEVPIRRDDAPLTNETIKEDFHTLVEKIGASKVSAYFARTSNSTLVLVKQDPERMLRVLENPVKFTEKVNAFAKEQNLI